ncbi:MAG: hypothetical protein WD426_20890 [Anditalea sp.]
MILRLAILPIFFLSFILSAPGQEGEDVEAAVFINAQAIKMHAQQESMNSAIIQQVGENQQAITIQEQTGYQPNFFILSQKGYGNSGFIEQAGTGLNSRVIQRGNRNETNLWSIGQNINTFSSQVGDGNVINSYIKDEGITPRSASLIQEGNQNRIDLSLMGNGIESHTMDQHVRITQQGNQHEISALMEPFSAPFEITQTPGANGEGMKVNVSTSQFNFPMRK